MNQRVLDNPKMLAKQVPCPRVLCVDDHEDTCILIKAILHGEGIEAHTAGNANDALEAISGNDYALIIIDVWLPEMSGLDLCREIRKTDKNISIVFYSADAIPGKGAAAMEAGGNAYLVKPYTDQLLETVKRYVYPNDTETQPAHHLKETTIIDRINKSDFAIPLNS